MALLPRARSRAGTKSIMRQEEQDEEFDSLIKNWCLLFKPTTTSVGVVSTAVVPPHGKRYSCDCKSRRAVVELAVAVPDSHSTPQNGSVSTGSTLTASSASDVAWLCNSLGLPPHSDFQFQFQFNLDFS